MFKVSVKVKPGYAAHFWHTFFCVSKAKGYKVMYPTNFEEIYYIVSGDGGMQLKNKEGRIREQSVGGNHTIFVLVAV